MQAGLPKHWGSCSNYKPAKTPQRLIFPLAPKQEEEGGVAVFYYDGPDNSSPLVYVFLASLITAERKKSPWKQQDAHRQKYEASEVQQVVLFRREETSSCDFYMLSSTTMSTCWSVDDSERPCNVTAPSLGHQGQFITEPASSLLFEIPHKHGRLFQPVVAVSINLKPTIVRQVVCWCMKYVFVRL